MTRLSTIALILVLAVGKGSPASAGAVPPAEPAAPSRSVLRPGPASTLVMQGSSNVTGWRCRGTSLDGQMDVAASIEKINAVIDSIEDGNIGIWMENPSAGRFPQPTFEMQIPIATLRCGNRGIERDMKTALKADQYPVIEFRFKELRGHIEHDLDRNVYEARVAGEITLAGARRNVEMPVTAQRIDRDRFRLQAGLPLRMTDFGIAPPTALFGVIKVRDELYVRFDLTLQVAL